MDVLIELIVRGILSLFGGGGDKPAPPPLPKPVTTMNPNPPQPVQRVQARGNPRQRPAAQRRPVQFHARPGGVIKPAPAPRPMAPPPPPQTVARPTTSPAPPSSAPIRASAIAQLMRSRPGSLRTIYVLAEIIQPPLALREMQ